jgi:hypothetical protein
MGGGVKKHMRKGLHPCNLIFISRLSSFFYPEKGGRKYLQKTGNDISDYKISHPRRQ